jgi:hypothetical protein
VLNPSAFGAQVRAMLAAGHELGADRLVRRATEAAAEWLASGRPAKPAPGEVTLGHGDPNLANFLWAGTQIRIVDFEDSGPSCPAFELAILVEHRSAWSECGLDAAGFLALFHLTVAGSGEQRLLRIAAKHADMINLSLPSGDSLARIPHKLDVLRQHCVTVGRDPSLITVTYKAALAVAESREQARADWDQWSRQFGISEPAAEAGAFVGEPVEIADMIRPFLDAGVQHLVVELAGGADPESIALAAKALGPLAAQ